MARAKKSPKKTGAVEQELQRLLSRLSKPGVDRWEADTAKVRHLVSLDASRVVRRLEQKQDEAVALFSRLRTREALVALCRSAFTTITFPELARLSPKEQRAAQGFHDVLDELRWYVSYTEDMPSTVKTTVSQYVRRLDELRHALNATLGPPDAEGHPVIDVT
ncbi:MAG: hypothetical protein ACOZQL_25640 [Myxococcota bacterium]